MALSGNTIQWENVLHLLKSLSEEDLATVYAFAERLARREMAVKEAVVPYNVPTRTIDPVSPSSHVVAQPMTAEEALDFLASGPPGFAPGELDDLLADIESTREMELDTICQPI